MENQNNVKKLMNQLEEAHNFALSAKSLYLTVLKQTELKEYEIILGKVAQIRDRSINIQNLILAQLAEALKI